MAALQLHGTGTPLGDPIEVGAACAVAEDFVTASAASPDGTSTSTWTPLPLALGATKVRLGEEQGRKRGD